VRRLIADTALVLALPLAPALAADRVVQVGSFSRLRVEAPVEVTITAGSPRATVSGDPRGIEGLEVGGDTGTLVVRRKSGAAPVSSPLRVTLSTPALAAIAATGGAKVDASGLKAARVDLALTGAGSLAVRAIDAGQVSLVVAGNGRATIAGKTGTARLTISGAGDVDAAALVAGDLTVSSDGAGTIGAAARYTATIANTGSGQVTITGTPKCVIRAGSIGPVTCGKPD